MSETDVFKYSTPTLYDKYMGPLLFEPFAKHVAKSVALVQPELILETAAGTGIVTRAVSEDVPNATVVATTSTRPSSSSQLSRRTRSASPFSKQTRGPADKAHPYRPDREYGYDLHSTFQ